MATLPVTVCGSWSTTCTSPGRLNRASRTAQCSRTRVSSSAVEDAVRRHCAERLARFKRPSRVEVVEELPLTVTGKVQKGRLRNLERRRASAGLLE